jgi:hypothetical protein
MRLSHVRVIGACFILLVPPVAQAADPPTAADKAAAGAEAQKAAAASATKRFRAAAELYESAYKHSQDVRFLFSAAGAWQKNGDLAHAAATYARYLKEAPEKAPSRDKAKKELDALAPKVGQLAIKADGATQVSIDSEILEAPIPPVVYVPIGTHQIDAKFGAKAASQSTTATPGSVVTVTLVPQPDPPAPPAPVVVAPHPAPPPTPKPEHRKPFPPLVAYIGGGVAVVAGGLTIISGLDTSKQKDTFNANRTQENLDSGKSKELRTNILLAVTGAAVVFTGVSAIFLVDWKGKAGDSVQVGAGPGTLTLRSNF